MRRDNNGTFQEKAIYSNRIVGKLPNHGRGDEGTTRRAGKAAGAKHSRTCQKIANFAISHKKSLSSQTDKPYIYSTLNSVNFSSDTQENVSVYESPLPRHRPRSSGLEKYLVQPEKHSVNCSFRLRQKYRRIGLANSESRQF